VVTAHLDRAAPTFQPADIDTVEATGLPFPFLINLAMKHIYLAGTITGHDLARQMRLPFLGVVERVLEAIKRQQYCEVRSGTSLSAATYEYALTARGNAKAQELLERSAYAGPAPVPVALYREAVRKQSIRNIVVTRHQLKQAYSHLVLNERLFDQLGPAINSGRSIFLFGPPGNGKTSIAESVVKVLGGAVYIPYALEHDGEVIKLYDPVCHPLLSAEEGRPDATDRRWLLIQRPVVVVGGELTLANLDLVYSETGRYYEAPFQLKANMGMFLIDDFGRQAAAPRDLLNRWTVPLEKGEDYLNLKTGQEITVPFDQIIIFSTNLEPRVLVDEAFLRRIRYKIEVSNPTIDQYEEIFRRVCQERGVQYDPIGVQYVLRYCEQNGIELRCCHPRDLVDHVLDVARYRGIPAVLTRELVEGACESYFVRL